MRARAAVVTARMRAEFEARPTYFGEAPCGACGGSLRSTATGRCVMCMRSTAREFARKRAAEKRQAVKP